MAPNTIPNPNKPPRKRHKNAVDPAIHDLCIELWANQGRAYSWIAEYLFHNRGISNSKDPSKPVHTSTVMRWINKGAKEVKKNNSARRDLEEMVAGYDIDTVKAMLFDMQGARTTMTVDQQLKLIEVYLKYCSRRSSLFGVDAPRRKEVALTHAGGAEVKLDPATEELLSTLEDQVQRARQARRSP